MQVSEQFRLAILRARVSGIRQYQLAQRAEVPPAVLSALINGIVSPRENDPRIVAVGALLGLTPEQCFEQPSETSASAVA